MLMSTRRGYRLRPIVVNFREVAPGDTIRIEPRSDFATAWDAVYIGCNDAGTDMVVKNVATGIRQIVRINL